jgi:hypothetical protein
MYFLLKFHMKLSRSHVFDRAMEAAANGSTSADMQVDRPPVAGSPDGSVKPSKRYVYFSIG